MVATRNSMRTDPQEEEEAGAAPGGQVAMEIGTPASPMQTRSRIKRDSESEVLGDTNHEDVESTIMNLGTDLPEPTNLVMQMVTRSRRRSGQSDGDVSEAESNCSSHSTRMTRSRPVLSYLTDSARKLRSHRSGVVTEPIMESIEDGELSEAESNCSSVSTRAMRRQTGTSSSLGTTRSRRSVLASEPIPEVKEDAEVSEVESNCSSVSGVQDIKHTRFTRSRKSIVKCPPPLLLSQTEDISDAESCSSGISAHPIARNVTRSMKCKSKPEEDESASKTRKDVDQELEKSRKQSNTLRGVIVSEPLGSERSSSVTEQELLSSPRRSLRSRQVSQHKDVMIVAVIEPQRMEHSKENTSGNDGKSKERETPMKMGNVSYEESLLASPTKSTFQSTKNVPGQIDVAVVKTGSANSTAECKEVEQSTSTSNEATFTLVINSDDSDDKISEGSSDLDEVNLQGSNVPYHDRSGIVCKEVKRGNIISLLDSDESEDSEHSYVDAHEVTHKDGKEKDYNEDLVENREPQEILHQPSEDSQNDCLFVIDTAPGLDADKKYYVDHEDDDDDDDAESEDESDMEEPSQPVTEEDDFIDEDEDAELLNKPKRGFVLSTSIDPGLNIKDMGGLYITFDAEKPNPGPSLLKKMKERENKKKEELLQKSVITPDFEQKESVPPYKESVNKLKKQRREEREKTTGQGWFDMKAPEMTEELKNDLKALKMRSAMDPKRFYKKNDRDAFPKYFQVGTVVDSPVDFYHSRIPKKQRKRTIVEELLADSEFRRYNKKKYQEIIAEKAALAEGKKNRKKKKFKK